MLIIKKVISQIILFINIKINNQTLFEVLKIVEITLKALRPEWLGIILLNKKNLLRQISKFKIQND